MDFWVRRSPDPLEEEAMDFIYSWIFIFNKFLIYKGKKMREITYREAINEAYREEMRNDRNIVTFGEDLAEYGGAGNNRVA